ncbi:hypothetical protein D3C80_263620 [compost metagenome]
MGLQHGRAERRCEDQGDQHRKRHGRNDRHRELLVHFPRCAAEKRHRHEDGGNHHGDAHERALDFSHRFFRGRDGIEMLVAHDTLDIFHHHDRIIHQQTDRQNHGKHGERIDRKSERRHDAEGSKQNHRHGQRRDQRRAEIMQEDQHHEHDQHNRFDERVNDRLDGKRDKRRRIIGNDIAHAGGKKRAEIGHLRLHQFRRFKRIGAGRQLDRHA